MPTIRVLNIHVANINDAPDHETVNLALSIKVGFSDTTALTDSLNQDIAQKNGLGLYRTSIEMNLAVADAVKSFLNSSYSIPTNGYAAVYVSGAYGLLNIL